METEDRIYLIFEIFKGEELFSVVKKIKKLKEHAACYYFYNVIKTMQTLADNNIAHRDIKAENVLLNEDMDELKLIDFGFSIVFDQGKLLTAASGSPAYTAPEILAKEKFDPVKADIWSAGILLYFMLCGTVSTNLGYLPFFDEDSNKLFTLIMFGDLNIPISLNHEAIDLIKKLLNPIAKNRPSFTQIL